MTSVQLNAQIWRDMGILADSEPMMKRAAKYLHKLVAEKEDPTRFTKEEFFHRVDESKKQYLRGEYTRFSNKEEMNAWLNSL